MSNDNTFRATQYLPQATVATALVVVVPVVVVWLLLANGVVSSPWIGVGLATVVSFTASILGSAYWKRRSRPGDFLFSELMLWGWLHRYRSERRLANAIGLLDRGRSEDSLLETDESIERKAQLLTQIAAALDAHDSYTDGHSRRVAVHAAMIARKMGLSQEAVAKISTAAAVHDVGKLRIPVEVLNKRDRLTTEEFEIVKSHADEGAKLVSCIGDPAITEMVRHHHERFDGSGYPEGLAGEQIPTGARIIAVADTFDALTSERPYRGAVRHKTALGIIRVVSRTQLDPVAVRAFLKCYSGKRAVFFWTLLAVSPQRALASVSGRSAGRASIGSATTVAMPAALAALVVAAVGTGAAARAPLPLRFAQSQPLQLGVVLPMLPTPKHSTAVHTSRSSARSRHAVLGVTRSRTPKSGGLIVHVRGRTGSANGQGSSGQPVGGPRHRQPITAGRGKGAPKHSGGSKKPPSTEKHHPPAQPAAPPSSSSPAPSSPPAGGGSGGGGSGNGTGGNQGGNQGGHQGGNGGGNQGGGSGGGGSSGPPSKQACFDGGWANYSFPNQGQCVASFEQSLHG